MPATLLAREIGSRFAEALIRLGLSKVVAAKQIGVSRQMLYEYLNGKSLPKDKVLQAACQKWGLEIDYKGFLINSRAFSRKATGKAIVAEQLRLDLRNALDTLTQKDLGIRLDRKHNGKLELRIEIKFGS